MLNQLAQQMYGSRVLNLVKQMLTAKVIMPDDTKGITVKGTQQGGPLSPLLFNIVLNEWDARTFGLLERVVSTPPLEFVGYWLGLICVE